VTRSVSCRMVGRSSERTSSVNAISDSDCPPGQPGLSVPGGRRRACCGSAAFHVLRIPACIMHVKAPWTPSTRACGLRRDGVRPPCWRIWLAVTASNLILRRSEPHHEAP
jgi:hypothetical protein